MDKRLMKRHKRQVERARAHVKVSEPDLRTPEEIKAAREASHSGFARQNAAGTNYSGPALRGHGVPPVGSASKADA